MADQENDHSKSLETWILKRAREQKLATLLGADIVEIEESAEKILTVCFDPSTDTDQVIKLLSALSDLYRGLGGKGLVIRRAA